MMLITFSQSKLGAHQQWTTAFDVNKSLFRGASASYFVLISYFDF